MPPKKESYNNLIDFCLSMEADEEISDDRAVLFSKVLAEYFFKKETKESKNFNAFLSDLDVPDFIKNTESLLDIDINKLEQYVNGESVNASLAGKIMLSTQYLKAFYSHHSPSFSKLPEDIKFELIDKVKEKNSVIISAFKKMGIDKDSDTKRKIITLIALILKNVHRKTGRPLKNTETSAVEIITSLYKNADSLFTADKIQTTDLKDDSKIKDLIKNFFIIRQYGDIKEISEIYKSELDRYIKRRLRSS